MFFVPLSLSFSLPHLLAGQMVMIGSKQLNPLTQHKPVPPSNPFPSTLIAYSLYLYSILCNIFVQCSM